MSNNFQKGQRVEFELDGYGDFTARGVIEHILKDGSLIVRCDDSHWSYSEGQTTNLRRVSPWRILKVTARTFVP